MSDTLSLTLKSKSRPVELQNEDGTASHYELREVCAQERDQHLDLIRSRLEVLPDGKSTLLRKMDGIQSDLLRRCMVKQGGGTVTDKEIRSWPSNVVQALYDAAKEINGLNKDQAAQELETAKNG